MKERGVEVGEEGKEEEEKKKKKNERKKERKTGLMLCASCADHHSIENYPPKSTTFVTVETPSGAKR